MVRRLLSESLSFKVALSMIAVLTVLGGGAFSYIYFKIQAQLIQAQEREALTLATALESSLAGAMLAEIAVKDPNAIQTIFETVGDQRKEIKNIYVFGHDGRKAFTNHRDERGTFVNRDQEEQCLVCHRLEPENRPRAIILDSPEGRVVRGAVPIVKRPGCAKCHTQQEKLRGMLLVDVETKEIESALFLILMAGIVTYVSLISVIYLALKWLVTKPIDTILRPVTMIGKGDLSARINSIKREDSIGVLVNGISMMVEGLRALVSKINAAIGWVEMSITSVKEGAVRLKSGIDIQNNSASDTSMSVEKMKDVIAQISNSIARLTSVSEETSASTLEMTASIEEIAAYREKLDGAVHEVISSVTQMISSIKEVAGSAKDLSDSTAETASSMIEINTSLKEIEGNAVRSGEISREASQDTSDGKIAVEEVIRGIAETRSEIKTTAQIIKDFEKASKEIEKILTIINQIAQQTNLLALNASIIASQAGEHGKSFGVVASEIKKLSDQTGTSTKEIAALITNLKTETNKAVDVMGRAEKGIDNSVSLALRAGDVFTRILESSERSRDIVDIIVKATKEQAKGASSVTRAVEQINNMIARIAKATQEQSEAAEFVTQIMENMKDISERVSSATSEQTKGSRQISNSTVTVNEMVQHINKAIKEQKRENDNVIKSLENIINAIKTNSDSVKDLEEAVNILSLQMETLKEEVNKFSV